MAEGIRKRHSKGCRARSGGRCSCNAGYEAWVFSKRDGKKIRETFRREAEAKSWRADALAALTKGGLRAPKPSTLGQAWTAWYEGAKSGAITNRSGDPYKPSALRSYEQGMRLRVLPVLQRERLTEISRPDLQELANRLVAEGHNPSTIQVTLLPLRAIFRRALSLGEVVTNPCTGLELPAVRGRRERYATPAEAEALIAALPGRDRPIWATAMYAGLRRGELRALRVEDVDLEAGVIRVEQGWDPREGEIKLKSNAGRRRVPISEALRPFLVVSLRESGRSGADRIYGSTPTQPFAGEKLSERADRAWKPAGLDRITLHECRWPDPPNSVRPVRESFPPATMGKGGPKQVKRQRHTPEQVIPKLRVAEQMLSGGKSAGEAAKALEVSEQTLHRWRNQYGGMKAADVKRLKELEKENAQLKRLVADKELEALALKEIAKGNF